jgi:hypothetical protein
VPRCPRKRLPSKSMSTVKGSKPDLKSISNYKKKESKKIKKSMKNRTNKLKRRKMTKSNKKKLNRNRRNKLFNPSQRPETRNNHIKMVTKILITTTISKRLFIRRKRIKRKETDLKLKLSFLNKSIRLFYYEKDHKMKNKKIKNY